MEQKMTDGKTSKVWDNLKKIAQECNHRFVERNPYKAELVRMMGDQVDSRLSAEFNNGFWDFHYTLWVDGEGNKISKYPEEKELKKTLQLGNKDFEKEVIERDGNPEEY